MCGIIGYIGKEKCLPIIIKGLKALEYRGYDSAGLAYVLNNKVNIIKEKGRISNLESKVDLSINSYQGIGHTRWATHGEPSQKNSHPHKVGKVTVVHNGIIENYETIKKELKEYNFISDTDTEVIAALLDKLLKENDDIISVLPKLKDYLIGSYALGIIIDGIDSIYAIRKDSPLIIGVSENGSFIASDIPAILDYTNMYYLLLNDEFAVLNKDDIVIYDSNGNISVKNIQIFEENASSPTTEGYDHFMLKEIYEQPTAIKNTIKDYLSKESLSSSFSGLEKYETIDIVGCGSAYHVGLVGKSLITKYGQVTVNVEVASEYRYTKHVYHQNHLIILISQSGETADTLAVLRQAKKEGIKTLAIVNVIGSSIAREADDVIYIKAGPEIAVATTKAYSCQLMILSLIATYLGLKNNLLDEKIFDEYNKLPEKISTLLKDTSDTKEVANLIYNKKDIFFIGRKIDYSLCMEASLKLKEVSYLHSEAYAAGELKHGTISLIEKNTPVISIITEEDIKLKTLNNIKEVCARGALSIIISSLDIEDKNTYQSLIKIPKLPDLLSSVLVIIKCQLIAYYVAKLNNCDIDKPRNLAKSVTVE